MVAVLLLDFGLRLRAFRHLQMQIGERDRGTLSIRGDRRAGRNERRLAERDRPERVLYARRKNVSLLRFLFRRVRNRRARFRNGAPSRGNERNDARNQDACERERRGLGDQPSHREGVFGGYRGGGLRRKQVDGTEQVLYDGQLGRACVQLQHARVDFGYARRRVYFRARCERLAGFGHLDLAEGGRGR